MLRILSWSPGLGCDNTHDADYTTFVSNQPVSSVADFAFNHTLKRKRSFTCDKQTVDPLNTVANDATDPSVTEIVQANTVEPVKANINHRPVVTVNSMHSTSSDTADLSQLSRSDADKCSTARIKTMRQTISTQLNLEILVKHKELRLIDQEIAKCQIALEQLRRCSEIPYPGTQQPMVSVSEGKGAALRRQCERYPARSPAPWGVADGPYTRHYSKWLLPDARFDGGEAESPQIQNIMDAAVPARSTRGSFVESGKTLKSRSLMRGGTFQSLPAGYGQPKEKATGPMILKRKSDNTMVKLVCPDCGRHDFGSAQGFINHCRIGHGRSFASHDAAAEACGEPVEYNDNGTVKGVETVTTPTTTNMHPLIRSAKLLSQVSNDSPLSTRVEDPTAPRAKKSQPVSGAANFSPSVMTPHLSALIQSQGLGLDLQNLVQDAKAKLETAESDNEDDEMEIDSPIPTNTGRHPQVAGSKQPVKSVSTKQPSPLLHSLMQPSRATNAQNRETQEHRPESNVPVHRLGHEFLHNLIPSPTNDSTQAPSLVDDDEEFDPQSPPSSDEIDEAEIDFDVHDDDNGDRTVLRGGELPSPPGTCAPTSPSRNHTRRSSTIRKSFGSREENKSVSFASPSPHPEGSNRKRRKIDEK